ncbi:MAG: hypothetical protein ACK5RL_15530 [Acidimicrobiales bacterium]
MLGVSLTELTLVSPTDSTTLPWPDLSTVIVKGDGVAVVGKEPFAILPLAAVDNVGLRLLLFDAMMAEPTNARLRSKTA